MWAATPTLAVTLWRTRWRPTGQSIELTTKATRWILELMMMTARSKAVRRRRKLTCHWASRLNTAPCTTRTPTRRLRYVELVNFYWGKSTRTKFSDDFRRRFPSWNGLYEYYSMSGSLYNSTWEWSGSNKTIRKERKGRRYESPLNTSISNLKRPGKDSSQTERSFA